MADRLAALLRAVVREQRRELHFGLKVAGALIAEALIVFPHDSAMLLLSLPDGSLVPVIALICVVEGELLRWTFRAMNSAVPLRATTIEGSHIVGYVFGVCGVLYAVVLAFVVVTAWQQFDHAEEVALAEQNAADMLSSVHLPKQTGHDLFFKLQLWHYANDTVADADIANHGQRLTMSRPGDEAACSLSAVQAAEKTMESAFASSCIGSIILAWKPISFAEHANYMETLSVYRTFLENRLHRIHHTNEHLPAVMWWSLILGAIVIVTFTFFFDEQWSRAQAIRTAALSMMIGIMLAEALVFDHPFSGSHRIDPSRWTDLACQFNQALSGQNHAARRPFLEEPSSCTHAVQASQYSDE